MSFTEALHQLAANPAAPLDVADVALLLASDEYPDLDVAECLDWIDQLACEVSPRLIGDLCDRTAALGSFLFEERGFRGNERDYYDPRNSYLNDVIERRLGIPITLSVLAMSVGARAGIEVVGVGLPGHFIAKAVAENEEVLFDPFHGGRLLEPEDCIQLVETATGQAFDLTAEAFEAVPLGALVARMLTNLKGIYLKREDFHRAVRIMERLLILAPDDVVQRRDLGVALVRADRPGAAIAHLETYLAHHHEGDDAELVEKVLQRAKKNVARWN
jgi:regulator of sirC expression with transglutaminase-like and TPR domain